MSARPPDGPPGPPPEPPERPPQQSGPRPRPWPRWVPIVAIALVAGLLLFNGFFRSTTDRYQFDYSEFIQAVRDGEIKNVEINQDTGKIVGEFKDTSEAFDNKKEFETQGPRDQIPESDIAILDENDVGRDYQPETTNVLLELLPWLIFLGLIIGLFIWMQRRAQGQMAGVMSIGKSKAKVYATEKPKTTFDDVAGYRGVKKEITEVVDFLKHPHKFRDIGAKIPKGVLLVGPPGTGKTLIARAVAGEAGVPFIAVTGSDFMEMFVGVGASRVRDLFQNARKQAPAIIFIDELDSIGRKRGAGLGGGHDEREQTLNQILGEMDGFEPTEGLVVMAATNRPDVLDPALLRPGRFDRQVLVPLPSQEERSAILKVHFKDKKIAADVDVETLAKGTPGMSGADLANLVNEAALYAVRRGDDSIHDEDFENARDRVLMGLKRESMAMSEEEKEAVAFHEAGHAVAAYVLEHADPVHKVTILPTGMALGVTQQLPEERHIHRYDYIADSLVVRMGGRVAEALVYDELSTGANNDLVGATELARKMVREWGMSDRVGPMAWGSQGQVFLGEDLVHTRDYSDDTARVIDEEVERILRTEEERCTTLLTENRAGLDAVAHALLERETLEGSEVERLVDEAMGRRVGGKRVLERADGSEVEVEPPDTELAPDAELEPEVSPTPTSMRRRTRDD